MVERSSRLPSQRQVIELLEGEFARAGYDVEDVVIDTSARPPRIAVVADGDNGLDLDTIAALSRTASELLDELDTSPYVLEVTSPGVDRPLTTPTHFRRARGRRVELTLTDGSTVAGRLGDCSDQALALVVRERSGAQWSVREIALSTVANAVVQVEFSPPNPRELELAGVAGEEG